MSICIIFIPDPTSKACCTTRDGLCLFTARVAPPRLWIWVWSLWAERHSWFTLNIVWCLDNCHSKYYVLTSYQKGIDIKFAYPNNPDGWRLSGIWGKHVCVVGIQLQGSKCKPEMSNFLQKQLETCFFLIHLFFSCSVNWWWQIQSKYNRYPKNDMKM